MILAASNLQVLRDDRFKYFNNPLIWYRAISNLRNIIFGLKEVENFKSFEYYVKGETKLDDIFPSTLFNVHGYEVEAKRDKN